MSPRKLPGVVPAFPDEALTSWLERIASHYGLRASVLFDYLGPWSARLDYKLDPVQIAALQTATGVPAREIAALTISISAPWLAEDDLLEADLETELTGKVCASCLDEDAAADRDHYVRRSWLSFWRMTCPKHQELLMDRTDVVVDPSLRDSTRRTTRFRKHGELQLDPLRRRRFAPMRRRSALSAPSATLRLLETDIERAMAGAPFNPIWSCGALWPDARAVMIDLGRFLTTRQWGRGVVLARFCLDPNERGPTLSRSNFGDDAQGTSGAVAQPDHVGRR